VEPTSPRTTGRFGEGVGVRAVTEPKPLPIVLGTGVGVGDVPEGVVFWELDGDIP